MRGVSAAGVAGKKGHEYLSVRVSPSRDRVPAGCCLVAGERGGRKHEGVVAGGYVVEGLVVLRAAGDLVDGGVDEAEVPVRELVGQRDQPGPEGGCGAGAGGWAHDGLAGMAAHGDNGHPRVEGRVTSDIRYATGGVGS